MGKKKTLIINYRTMSSIGGIEQIIVGIVEFMINHDVRVIWLKEINSKIHPSYMKIMKDKRVEIVDVSNNLLLWFKHGTISLSSNEDIVILSFIFMSKVKAEWIIRENPTCNIRSIYVIPDTKGLAYHIESNFNGILKKAIYRLMRSIHNKWQKNHQLLFCALKQIEALENNYNISVDKGAEKIIKGMHPIPDLNYDTVKNRSRRENFNIITVGRLDFPHKQYIKGLVKSFARLKSKYPNISLTIIGDGHSRGELVKEINSYANEIKKDVILLGTIAYKDLPQYMEKAHLNISVAGGVAIGAINGVVSIPARNYCKGECEVYGFLPDSIHFSVSTMPGQLVDPYIEKVIKMNDKEYMDACITSYHAYKDKEDIDPWFIFNGTNDYCPYSINKTTLYVIVLINYLMKITYFFKIKEINKVEVVKNFFRNFSIKG